MKDALKLVNDLVLESQRQDLANSFHSPEGNQISKSWMTFHLETLKGLIEKYDRERTINESESN